MLPRLCRRRDRTDVASEKKTNAQHDERENAEEKPLMALEEQ